MALYARPSPRLAGQVLGDLAVVVWVVAWGFVAAALRSMITSLADGPRRIAETTGGVAGDVRGVGDQLERIPAIGGGLRVPFDGLSDGVNGIRDVAAGQVQLIEHVGAAVFWTVFLAPALGALLVWMPRRLAFHRRNSASRRLLRADSGVDLFALRGLTSLSPRELERISDDPVRDWRAAEPQVLRALAGAELARVGLRLPDVRPAATGARGDE